MGYAIRDACGEDFERVASFLDLHLRRDYFIPHRQLRDILSRRWHECVVAIDQDRVLGIAIATKRRRTLVNLLVASCERKRGIADALLSRLRVERIRVKTNVTDGDPTGYYLKRGFRLSSEKTGKRHIRIAVVDLDSPPKYL